jgi:ubiquinone biosynthesis accessory factor UbiJ
MNKPPFFAWPPLPQGLVPPPPPVWLVGAVQNQVLLVLNHILQQEPQAMDRLRRQQGRVVAVRWDRFDMALQASPAGLLAMAMPGAEPDLRLTLTQAPWALAQAVWSGDKPAVDIQGDVLLAAEVAWLFDNVRWDVEEDLSRWVGDAAAHQLVAGLKVVGATLQKTLKSRMPAGGASPV